MVKTIQRLKSKQSTQNCENCGKISVCAIIFFKILKRYGNIKRRWNCWNERLQNIVIESYISIRDANNKRYFALIAQKAIGAFVFIVENIIVA